MKNCKNRGFTLTSPAGHFVFDCETLMIAAQCVRDFITTMVVDPGAERPPRPDAAQRYVREHMNGPHKDIPFVWIPIGKVAV